jgi:hypothetical protein
MHNGTLNGWNSKDYQSDTHWALDKIRREGTDALKTIFGAFVFVWTAAGANGKFDTINIVRNSERPLCLAFTTNDKTALFASEPHMLYWLAHRNDLKLRKDEIFMLETGVHYAFPVDSPATFTKRRVELAKTSSSWSQANSQRTTTPSDWATATKNRIVNAVREALDIPEDPVVTHLTANSFVTPAERTNARTANVQGAEVTFEPIMYDIADRNSFLGTTSYPFKDGKEREVECTIRHVSDKLASEISNARDVTCTILGVIAKDPTKPLVSGNIEFVLSKPVTFNYANGQRKRRKDGVILPPIAETPTSLVPVATKTQMSDLN